MGEVERGEEAEAPPKQVAVAMERLGDAARLIAEIRLGADRLLEAIFLTSLSPHQQNTTTTPITTTTTNSNNKKSISNKKALQLIAKEEINMRQHFQHLRSLGWLALKAFTDQKRRFFPHLEDESLSQEKSGEFAISKKLRCSFGPTSSDLQHDIVDEIITERKTLSDILTGLETDAPNLKIFTYQRLDWVKRASSLSSSLTKENRGDSLKDSKFPTFSKLMMGTTGTQELDRVAVIELWVPSVFRAVVSLNPAGSVNPDSVAFFSPDEVGTYIHSRGSSVHHVYQHLTDNAGKALQYFLGTRSHASLDLLFKWISGYQTLFTKLCSKCSCLLAMDKPSGLLLPPVYRPFQQLPPKQNASSTQPNSAAKDQSSDASHAYHIGCVPGEA
ncbi:hypothetical protein AMTRI_Chr01g102700 [Amborella trichopoda]